MRQKPGQAKPPAEKVVKEIRRATRKHCKRCFAPTLLTGGWAMISEL